MITSGKDFRVPPPPDTSATELEQLHDLVAKNDAQVAAKITFWDAGSPGYRWIDLVNNRVLTGQ
ncbi:PA-phosphatase, partial [Rhizobium ruizarguesonis]